MPSYKKIHLELAEQFMDNTGGFFKSIKDVLKYAQKDAMEASSEINQVSTSNHHLKFDSAYKSFCSIVISALEQMSEEQKFDFVTSIVKERSHRLFYEKGVDIIKNTNIKYDNWDESIDNELYIKEMENDISKYKTLINKENTFSNLLIADIIKDIKKEGFNNLLFGNIDYLSDIASKIELERIMKHD